MHLTFYASVIICSFSTFNTDIGILCWRKRHQHIPNSKVHGANMGLTWVLSAPDGPHVGPMNLDIRDCIIIKVHPVEERPARVLGMISPCLYTEPCVFTFLSVMFGSGVLHSSWIHRQNWLKNTQIHGMAAAVLFVIHCCIAWNSIRKSRCICSEDQRKCKLISPEYIFTRNVEDFIKAQMSLCQFAIHRSRITISLPFVNVHTRYTTATRIISRCLW